MEDAPDTVALPHAQRHSAELSSIPLPLASGAAVDAYAVALK
jgi:hypothetical protein